MKKRSDLEILRAELENERSSFITHWRQISDLIMPRRARFTVTDANRGERKNQQIIDSTATLAARTLRSGMMSGITSPARPWFRLSTADPEMNEFGAVKEWLYAVSQRMSTVFLKSNLYNQLPVIYGDIGMFGTSALLQEEDFDEVARFYPFPIGSYCIANDHRLRVNVFMREFRMTVRQLVNKFGRKDAKGNPDWSIFSNQIRSLWDQGSYETWIDIYHFVLPNEEYVEGAAGTRGKKFSSIYYESGRLGQTQNYLTPSPDDNKFLKYSGYDFFPVLAPRWETSGEDIYGTGCPGMDSLGDIKQLQVQEKRAAQAIEKQINPPMTGPSSLRSSRASIGPGDITFVDTRDAGSSFRAAHEVNLRLDFLENKQAMVRQRIQRAFYEDLFLMLLSDERSNITATEIAARKEEKLLALGPVLEQLNQDLLDPLIDNTFDIMMKQGHFPPPPPELEGHPLKVEYISVMAQAQKLVGIGGVERFMGFANTVAAVKPDIWDKIDAEKVIDVYAEMTSIPPDLLRTADEVGAIRSERAQAQQQQAQMEQVQMASQAAKNLSQTQLGGDTALSSIAANAGAIA